MSWGPTPKVKGPQHRQVFRSTTGLILGGLILILLVLGLVDAAVSGAWHFLGEAVPWMLLFAWVVTVLWIRPAVVLTDDGIEVFDLLRRFRIAWPALRLVVHRYLLTLVTKDGSRVQCFCAPATEAERRASAGLPPRRRGLRPGRDDGATRDIEAEAERRVPVKSVVEARWAAALGGTLPEPADEADGEAVSTDVEDLAAPRGLERQWDWPFIIAGIAIAVWCVLAVVL